MIPTILVKPMSIEGNQSADHKAQTVRDPELRRAANNRRKRARRAKCAAIKRAAKQAAGNGTVQEATQHSQIKEGNGAGDDKAEDVRKADVRRTASKRRRLRKTSNRALSKLTQSLAQKLVVTSEIVEDNEIGDGKARTSAESAENPSIETKPIFAIKSEPVVKLEPLADAE
jgi:hypothetical protein